LQDLLPLLPKAGVFPNINIELTRIQREFGPDAIESLSKFYSVPKNRVFIGSIHNNHVFDYEDLGGVRIIV
jgi:hypothetical protein